MIRAEIPVGKALVPVRVNIQKFCEQCTIKVTEPWRCKYCGKEIMTFCESCIMHTKQWDCQFLKCLGKSREDKKSVVYKLVNVKQEDLLL